MVRIKGTKHGLRLVLDPEAETAEQVQAIGALLSEGNAFLQGAEITLDVGQRPLDDHTLFPVLEAIARCPGVHLRAIEQSLATRTARAPSPKKSYLESSVHWGTVRSGQTLRSEGDLTVVGDANAGAKLLAEGSIVVTGTLRGTAHAGLSGNQKARVFAGSLEPTQVAIADVLATNPGDGKMHGPEVAFLENHLIVVAPWPPKQRRGRSHQAS